MKAGWHPLVAGLLQAIGAVASARAGLARPIPAAELDIDRLWHGTPSWPARPGRGGNARARRAALKRRNVIRNRRAHRG